MFRYNQGGEIIEIIIRDSSGAKIESYKFHTQDKVLSNKIMNTLKSKYGLEEKNKENIDKDIDWLKGQDW